MDNDIKIVKLKGGLGNQMFQYAFAKALELHTDSKIKLDCSAFENNNSDTIRQLRLFNFRTSLSTANITEVRRQCLFSHPGVNRSIFDKIKIVLEVIINRRYCFNQKCDYIEIDKLLQYSYFDGYWQSWRYVNSVSEILKKEFVFNEFERPSQYKDINNLVFIGVRKGDYTKETQLYGSFGEDYYNKAISWMEENIHNPVFLVFSNDINWVKENIRFNTERVIYRDDYSNDYEELLLMASCDHAIIVNSTFYWWAAWMIRNPNKIVVAPNKWFADGQKNDLIPPQWVKL